MEKSTAQKIIEAMLAAGEHLDRVFLISDSISDTEEKKEFRRRLGEIMGTIYTDIMMPIVRDYPDLDPDK